MQQIHLAFLSAKNAVNLQRRKTNFMFRMIFEVKETKEWFNLVNNTVRLPLVKADVKETTKQKITKSSCR